MIIESDTKKRILELLASSERGLSWRELKSELKVSDPVLAKHLKRLIEEGLITEKIDKKDRRVKIYKINDKGLSLLRKDILTAFFFVLIYGRFAYYSILSLMEDYKDIDELEEREKKAIIDGFGLFIRDLILEGLARKDETFSALLKALELFKKYVGYEFEDREYIKEEFRVIKSIEDENPERLLKIISEKIAYFVGHMLEAEKKIKTGDVTKDEITGEIIEKVRLNLANEFIKALEDVNPLLKNMIEEVKAKLEKVI